MFACRLCSNLGSKIVQTPKSLASMLKNIVSYPPLTHAFLKWPFLTDFKKYTHTPPYGTKFWCSGRKMEKTLRIHEFAPRWHVMNVPERCVAPLLVVTSVHLVCGKSFCGVWDVPTQVGMILVRPLPPFNTAAFNCGTSALTTRVLTVPYMQLVKDHVQTEG